MNNPIPTHPEDIKAALRKRYGSLAKFERDRDLGGRSVTDVLLGRRRPDTAAAIADALGHDIASLFPGQYDSATADDNAVEASSHRLIAGAR